MRASGLYAVFLLVVPIVAAQSNTPIWRGGTQEKICGLGTYHDSLDLAFQNATKGGGETLVTVQVLPSFRQFAVLTANENSLRPQCLKRLVPFRTWQV